MILNKAEREFLEHCREIDFSANVNKEKNLQELLDKLQNKSKPNMEGDYEDFNNRG